MPESTHLYDELSKLFLEKLNLEVPSIDTDLLETGLLDSLSFVALLLHLEQDFGKKIPAEDLEIDQFRSIVKIAEFVENHDHN